MGTLERQFFFMIAVVVCFFLCKTYETGRVVVLDSLGITECLENGISLQQLLFQLTLFMFDQVNASVL